MVEYQCYGSVVHGMVLSVFMVYQCYGSAVHIMVLPVFMPHVMVGCSPMAVVNPCVHNPPGVRLYYHTACVACPVLISQPVMALLALDLYNRVLPLSLKRAP